MNFHLSGFVSLTLSSRLLQERDKINQNFKIFSTILAIPSEGGGIEEGNSPSPHYLNQWTILKYSIKLLPYLGPPSFLYSSLFPFLPPPSFFKVISLSFLINPSLKGKLKEKFMDGHLALSSIADCKDFYLLLLHAQILFPDNWNISIFCLYLTNLSCVNLPSTTSFNYNCVWFGMKTNMS